MYLTDDVFLGKLDNVAIFAAALNGDSRAAASFDLVHGRESPPIGWVHEG
jgi:hypothetical protein